VKRTGEEGDVVDRDNCDGTRPWSNRNDVERLLHFPGRLSRCVDELGAMSNGQAQIPGFLLLNRDRLSKRGKA
jgi:hypothetical protein